MDFCFWDVMIEVSFWTVLAKKKLEEYKLTSSELPLYAKYKLVNIPDKMASLRIDAFSYEAQSIEERMGPVETQIPGTFLNTNTIEEFKAVDLDAEEDKLLTATLDNLKRIAEGKEDVVLPAFKLLTFADLKKHMFSRQFLSVAAKVSDYKTLSVEPVAVALKDSIAHLNKIVKSVVHRPTVPSMFVMKQQGSELVESSLKEFLSSDKSDFIFGCSDIVNFGGLTGFHTSSVLALFALLLQEGKVDAKRLSNVRLLLFKDFMVYNLEKDYAFKNSQLWTVDLSQAKLAGKLAQPRNFMELDLKSFMDERTLAREAVDLNIKLMKWRLLPSLDIPKVQSKKCLLFGAGTLGCQLARNLIGWGIKHISFIDYSKVSYSNPVRQSLYDYEDTLKGGRPKAIVAAEKLKKIYPEIVSEGYHISVPMPGHYVTTKDHIEETFRNLDLVEKLVSEHDVLFLLLDSREARWLPTVLANKYDKACITVGLGFDSFVIVRHGVSPAIYDKEKHRERLSCYFCNDIVTPQDTMKDRTLDQMCTVTRPGLSFTSSAYASELYISMIHHPMEHRVWADEDPSKLEQTDLGKLPHHLRGCMSEFEVSIFYGRAFEQCVACSKLVLDAYNNQREEFMMQVLNDPSYIHRVTGLDVELKKMEDQAALCFDVVDDDDDIEALLSQAREQEAKESKDKLEETKEASSESSSKQTTETAPTKEERKQ